MKKYFTWQYIFTYAVIIYFLAIILKDLNLIHFTEPADGMAVIAIYASACLCNASKTKEK